MIATSLGEVRVVAMHEDRSHPLGPAGAEFSAERREAAPFSSHRAATVTTSVRGSRENVTDPIWRSGGAETSKRAKTGIGRDSRYRLRAEPTTGSPRQSSAPLAAPPERP
jgi:hypothetical protein